MIIEISVAVIALAFLGLVIFLIRLMGALQLTLGEVNHTLTETRKQLQEVGIQAQKVVEHANQISFDLKNKSEALNPIFNAISNAGEVLEHKSSELKKECIALHDGDDRLHFSSEEKKRLLQTQGFSTVAAVLELSGIGINLWQKLKKRR